jgi:hypothetical protein
MNIESIVTKETKRKLKKPPVYIGWETTKETFYFMGISETDVIYIAEKCDFQIIYTPLGLMAEGIKEGYKTIITSLGYCIDEKPTLILLNKNYRVNDIYHEMGLKRPLKRRMI